MYKLTQIILPLFLAISNTYSFDYDCKLDYIGVKGSGGKPYNRLACECILNYSGEQVNIKCVKEIDGDYVNDCESNFIDSANKKLRVAIQECKRYQITLITERIGNDNATTAFSIDKCNHHSYGVSCTSQGSTNF